MITTSLLCIHSLMFPSYLRKERVLIWGILSGGILVCPWGIAAIRGLKKNTEPEKEELVEELVVLEEAEQEEEMAELEEAEPEEEIAELEEAEPEEEIAELEEAEPEEEIAELEEAEPEEEMAELEEAEPEEEMAEPEEAEPEEEIVELEEAEPEEEIAELVEEEPEEVIAELVEEEPEEVIAELVEEEPVVEITPPVQDKPVEEQTSFDRIELLAEAAWSNEVLEYSLEEIIEKGFQAKEEEQYHLAAEWFLYALSRKPASDIAFYLIIEFYRHWRNGFSPKEALNKLSTYINQYIKDAPPEWRFKLFKWLEEEKVIKEVIKE